MRVAAGACGLVLIGLLLLVDLPNPVSSRNVDPLSDQPPEEKEESQNFGFFTTTISTLSNMFGLSNDKDNVDDPDERGRRVTASDDDEDVVNEVSPKFEGAGMGLETENPETPKEDARVYEEVDNDDDDERASYRFLQGDEAPKEGEAEDGRSPDKPKDSKDPLLEKEGPKPKDKDSEKDKEAPASDPKPQPDKPGLEGKLDAIAAKEDEILKELDKEKAERESSRRLLASPNATGLVLVDRLKPASRSQPPVSTLPLKPGSSLPVSALLGGNGGNTSSLAVMSDPQFLPVSVGSVNELARYMRTCDSCLVTWDAFQCPLNDMAIELKKWITELEELLSFGCQLEGCDGSSKCCHRRDPAFERALTEMTDMARQMYNTFQSTCSNCPRNGGWTEWCEWGACSSTCGPGTRMRRRDCSNPTPKGGGRMCRGLAIETLPCVNADCCIPQHGNWSPWTPWSTCPVQCGMGTIERSRSCSSPPPNRCGRSCPGPSRETDRCDEGACCVHGNWGFWGPWTQCSATCDSGMRERRRDCDSPSPNHCGRQCPGRDMTTEPCYSNVPCRPPCTDGSWGPWQPWSHCSATCGSGMSTRMRRCDNPAPNFCGQRCSGSASDNQRCNSNRKCCIPLDGNWSQWSYWTPCSATCGSGMRDRSRSCTSPPPNQCGRSCSGSGRDNQRCEERPCCQNGNWGYWEPWTTPTQSCGVAVRERRRRCDSPPPNSCGLPCSGPASSTDQYDTRVPCEPVCVPLDGGWSQWSPLSPCSATCGEGSMDRFRTCTNPSPNRCGRSCPGLDRDAQRCNERSCCVPQDGNWSPWTSWSPCPVSCGVGTIERSRSCSSPPPNRCGRSCSGPSRESDRCQQQDCCIPEHGNWSPWTSWSPCPVSCGVGNIERSRSCSSPRPNRCGRTCSGPSRETDRCQLQSCCIPEHGNWSPWTSWSPCPVTCGVGNIERSRSCSSPSPNRCGRSCPGPSRETDRCQQQDCCIPEHGNWSPWTSWSPCPVSCGVGNIERSRSCSSPRPNRCGRSCSGPSRETDRCQQQGCCIPENGNWSPWTPWSRCPVTCGVGTIERSRSCSNPPPNRCGRSCSGPSRTSDRCNEGPCCVDPVWEPWGPWSQPGVTCGTASRERRRRCGRRFESPDCNRPCPGPEYDRESYDTGSPCITCIDGNWAPWNFWGSCSRTCGEGTQDRERTCSSPPPNNCGRSCMGPAKDMRRCNEGPCCIPRNGNWGDWGRWSPCSASCGSGVRDRSRRCDRPSPNECGRMCPGTDRDTGVCSGGACCTDGNWGPWGPWAQPSVTCGTYLSERRRRCDSPSANFCGRDCPGLATDTQLQDTRIPCETCIDGNWGSWQPWTQCLVTCGMGRRERARRCDSPTPTRCGRPCPGQDIETGLQRCGPDLGQPGFWSPWGPWDSCSRTCGRGQQTRRRRCDVSPCGSSCPGFDVDTQSCEQGPCCSPREWTPWTPWSNCDATCDRGRRTRQRTCRSVGWGDDCGSRCPGAGQEVDECIGLRPCGQPPEWTPWNAWCPCECRNGKRARRRTCESRDPFNRGSPVDISKCGGAAREEEYCDVRQACPVCVESCAGRVDGSYPACTSCSDYLKCAGGRAQMTSCGVSGYEYDSFIQKCVPAPSPSCTLVDCISTCGGLSDGRYPSCSGCEFYIQCSNGRHGQLSCPGGQEFNAHSGQCASGRSPTCIRAIRNTLEFMYSDAPKDSYFRANDLTEEERMERYLELQEEAGIAAKFNRSDEDFLREEEERQKQKEDEEKVAREEKEKEALKEKLEEEEEELEERIEEEEKILRDLNEAIEGEDEEEESKTVVIEEEDDDEEDDDKKDQGVVLNTEEFSCQKDCSDVGMGRYQSCKGCSYFLVCTKHGVPRHVKCPRHKHWDDEKKKCKRHSTTCPLRNDTNQP